MGATAAQMVKMTTSYDRDRVSLAGVASRTV
jgi:hypothetical protein